MGFDANAWRQATHERGDQEAPPDAEYDVELVDSKIATRDRDGAQWVVLRWRVISGRERDREWESMHTIDGTKPDGETNPGLAYTIESLEIMGVDVVNEATELDRLQAAVARLEGGAFAVQIKRSGNFTNTYPRRVLEQVAASFPGTGGYGEAPAGPSSAIYGSDAPARSEPMARDEQLASQTTRDEMSGRQPERTGESDVTPALAAGEFSHPPTAGDDVPWMGESPPKRDDVNPATGEAFGF